MASTRDDLGAQAICNLPALPRASGLLSHPPVLDHVLGLRPLLRPTSGASRQEQSPFFACLPLELRLLVYDLVLADARLAWARVIDTGGGVVVVQHFPTMPSRTQLTWVAGSPSSRNDALGGFFNRAQATGARPHEGALVMLKTCQRMYVLFRGDLLGRQGG